MQTEHKLIILAIILVALSLLIFRIQEPVNVSESPVQKVAQVDLGSCLLQATSDVTVYQRPELNASVFGTIAQGESQPIQDVTTSGWYAFEPGTAQAANVGIFRNRYVPPTGDFRLSGNCTDLTQISTLPANICFTMAQQDVPIYSSPDTKLPAIATIRNGGYVHAISTVGKNSQNYANYFVQVNTDQSTLAPGIQGWISGGDADFNGSCDTLPTQ